MLVHGQFFLNTDLKTIIFFYMQLMPTNGFWFLKDSIADIQKNCLQLVHSLVFLPKILWYNIFFSFWTLYTIAFTQKVQNQIHWIMSISGTCSCVLSSVIFSLEIWETYWHVFSNFVKFLWLYLSVHLLYSSRLYLIFLGDMNTALA